MMTTKSYLQHIKVHLFMIMENEQTHRNPLRPLNYMKTTRQAG